MVFFVFVFERGHLASLVDYVLKPRSSEGFFVEQVEAKQYVNRFTCASAYAAVARTHTPPPYHLVQIAYSLSPLGVLNLRLLASLRPLGREPTISR